MPLITTTDELKQYAPGVTESMYAEDFLPTMTLVQEHYLRPILGDTTLDALQTAYTGNTLNSDQEDLLSKCSPVLGHLCLYHLLPMIYSSTDSGGERVSTSQNTERSPKWAMDLKRDMLLTMGFQAVDILYKYLEDNKATWTDWVAEAYTVFKSNFINTTQEFHLREPICESRFTFRKLQPIMTNVEEMAVAGAIGDAFMNELRDKIVDNDALTAQETIVVKHLRLAIASLTAAQAAQRMRLKFTDRGVMALDLMTDESRTESAGEASALQLFSEARQRDGLAHLERAVKYLNDTASASVFATYYDSDYYTEPDDDDDDETTKPLPDFGNSTATGTFFIGGK